MNPVIKGLIQIITTPGGGGENEMGGAPPFPGLASEESR